VSTVLADATGMMGQFVVLGGGERVGVVPEKHHHS
jgi:hypothetical protein